MSLRVLELSADPQQTGKIFRASTGNDATGVLNMLHDHLLNLAQ